MRQLHSRTMRIAQTALRHVHPRKTPLSFPPCCSSSRTIYLHIRPLSTASASPFSQQHLDDSDDQQHYNSHYHLKEADLQRIKMVASRTQTPLSIAQCIKLGESLSTKSLLKNLAFLNRELPVRFSKRILELDSLPEELKKTEPFMNLAQNYSSSFQALQEYSDNSRLWFLSPNTYHREEVELEDNEGMQTAIQKEYADLLQTVTNRHKQDVVFMAHGISLFKQYQQSRPRPADEIQHFLNSFNRGRLGIRIMVGHHLALQSQLFHPAQLSSTLKSLSPPMMGLAVSTTNSKRVGIIEPQCDIEALINNATQSAQFIFFQHYNTVFPPHVHIQHSKDVGGQRVRFPVVPALLHHILFELLKNAMRATAEFHGLDKVSYPDIEVQLASSAEGDLQIQIRDHGGGMPQEKLAHPFNYMFTTASKTVCIDFPSILDAVEKKPQTSATNENLPLCGFGFGLATSRLYARLFGGDMTIRSIPGSGTEINIQLCRLENQIERFTD